MDKKAKPKKIGNKYQRNLFSLLIARMEKYTPNKEKKAAWWSTKGVPLEGYASIENKKE